MVLPASSFATIEDQSPLLLKSVSLLALFGLIYRAFMASQKTKKRDEPGPYPFEPLKSGKYIRVLNLHPAVNHDQALVGSLEQIDLQGPNVRNYDALSWCWGNQTTTETLRIEVNRTTYHMKITPNLASALKSLRDKYEWRTMWVDAICINQDNTSERNHQVAMMNLVYGKTSNVCIWLDDNKPTGKTRHFDAEIAFKFIQDQVLDLWYFDAVCQEQKNSPQWVALVHLMTKPWFSRRWVIQEIALAKHATVHCGDHKMDWSDFADAVSLFVEAESATHRLSEVVKGDKNFNHVQDLFAEVHTMGATLLVEMTSNLFRLTNEGKRKPLSTLEHLVSRLSVFDSSEVRDTIFALLAISKDTDPNGTEGQQASLDLNHNPALQKIIQENERLNNLSEENKKRKIIAAKKVAELLAARLRFKHYEVAYEKPVLDVYKQFVEFCIRQSGSLDIMCRPWAPRPQVGSTGRPTMSVPVEFQDAAQGNNTTRQTASQEPIHRKPDLLPMPSWIADKRNTAFVMSTHDVTPVKMERRNADPLVGLPDKRIYNASGDIRVRTDVLRFVRRDESDQSLFVEGFVIDKVERTTPAAFRGNIPADWLDLTSWDPDSKKRAPADICRTLVADRGPSGLNPPPFYERACTETLRLIGGLESLDTLRTINERQCTIVAQFLRRVREVIFNRQMIKTKGKFNNAGSSRRPGSLGIAPRPAKKTDLICILYGCSVPVILRKVPKTQQDIEKEREAMLKQYPMRLLKAVQTVKRRLKFWGHMKLAIKEWETENPDKARDRQARIADKLCKKCKSAPVRSDTVFSYTSVGPPNGDVMQETTDSLSPLSTPFGPSRATTSFEATIPRSSTWPSLPSRQTNIDEFINETASENEAAKDKHQGKVKGEQVVDMKFMLEYEKMREDWKAMIERGDYKWKSKIHRDMDKPIEAPTKVEDHYFIFIGECYIDEMMTGEALEIRTNEAIEDQVFEIR